MTRADYRGRKPPPIGPPNGLGAGPCALAGSGVFKPVTTASLSLNPLMTSV
jgi:hypothetical protein